MMRLFIILSDIFNGLIVKCDLLTDISMIVSQSATLLSNQQFKIDWFLQLKMLESKKTKQNKKETYQF